MNNYGTGGVLGAATALPATGVVANYIISGTTNKIVILGILATAIVSFVFNLTIIVRYFLNSAKK